MKVTKVSPESIEFEDGTVLSSSHSQDCCESHWLDFEPLTLSDFDGLDFDLTTDSFFSRISDFGIALNPVKGFPVRIAGYGINNGYYSSELTLTLWSMTGTKTYDISDCQTISD